MPLDLSQRRALVTGASSGLGREIAKGLHAHGAHTILSGRKTESLDALAEELDSRVETAPADLANVHEALGLAERVGAVDILVANAALPASGELLDFDQEQIDRALNVNLRAPMQLARALLPGMLERGRGSLVFVSSMSGKVAASGASVYSATKFGLRGFGFSLHEDLRDTPIGVSTVFPGFVSDAGMFADADQRLPAGVSTVPPSDVVNAVLRGIESGRAEIDVAPLVLRAGGWLGGPAPGLVAALSRRQGGQFAERLARAQRHKR